MMYRSSIFALVATAMTFAAEGVDNITVNAGVDSRIDSVTVKAGNQTLGTIAKDGSASWIAWGVGTAYTPTFTGVATGYEGHWSVTMSGQATLSGGEGDAITIPSTSYSGCSLSFYSQAKQYAVTLDQRSGSSGTASVTATYDAAMPSITVPTRAGYAFAGYYTGTNGDGTQYYTESGESAKNWGETSVTTLYAKWTADTYTVTLDRQSGSGGSSSVTATYGSAMPAITVPTLTGYTFAGYYSGTDGGTQYYKADGTSANNWDKTGDATIYAKWTAKTYTVTFDRQSGSGGSSSKPVTYGSAMPSVTVPARTGYKFDGYYTEANGGGTQYYKADGTGARTWDKTNSAILYAKWTAVTYKVKLDWQSGGGYSSVTATYDAAMPSITMPTLKGYTFGGYYTEKNGGGRQYYTADGASARNWDRARDTTLYAKWIANTYTIELDRESGSGGSSSVTAKFGLPMLTPIVLPTRPGYTFGGYYTHSLGDSTQYYTASGASAKNWNETSVTKLFAKWTANTYKVTFDQRSGSGGSGSVTATYNNAMPEAKMPTREGYTFGGYYTEVNGGGKQYYTASGASANNWSELGDTTLYANWKADTYEVAFDKNGADGDETMDNQVFTCDVEQSLNPVDFTYTGHEFVGWTNSTGEVYKDCATVSNLTDVGKTVTLYANWTGVVYNVSFDANGGKGTMDSMSCTYDVPTDLTAIAFTRDGYVFEGWTTNVADGVMFADGATVTNLTATAGAEVTLYACWTADMYEVEFNASTRGDGRVNDGHGNLVPNLKRKVVVGEAWDIPVTTNLTSYLKFVGWKYVDADGRMWTVPATVPPPSAGVMNLVAVWADDLAAAVDAPGLNFSTFATTCFEGDPAEEYIADWVDIVDEGVTVVQSGSLPPNSNDGKLYVSWFTTEVKEKGELSFWWKCDAKTGCDDKIAPEMWAGDSLRFGLYDDATKSITNEIVRLTNQVDWCEFVYTNEADSAVSFAWAFVYADGGWNNGGGRGWVDRVTWKPKESLVSFDANGGDGWMYGQVFTNDVEQSLHTNEFFRTGHEFVGWATNSTGEVVYTNRAEVSNLTDVAGETVTLYAKWNPEKYTVKFMDSGNEVGSITDDYGTAVTTPTYSPRTGYTFAGWTPAAPATIPAKDVTCKAQWTPNKYTVEFNENGGSGTMANQNFKYDRASHLSPNGFKKNGSAFAGWATAPDGDVVYADGATVSNLTAVAGGTVKLYAKWTKTGGGDSGSGPVEPEPEVVWTVTFDANNGTDEMSMQSFTNGVEQALASNAFVRAGNVFAGWTTNSTGVVVYADGESVTLATNTMLYAVWTPNKYTVTLHTNGDDEGSVVEAEYGTEVGDIAAPILTGHTFAGWFTAAKDGDPVDGETSVTNNMELFAQWTVNIYMLTFESDGGSEVESIVQEYGTAVTAPDDPTRTGYTFAGWTPALPETMPAENMLLTAQWTENGTTSDPEEENKDTPEQGNVDTQGQGNAGAAEQGSEGASGQEDTSAPVSGQERTFLWTPVLPDGGNAGDAVFAGEIAEAYDGYMQNAAGNVMGTISLKAAKAKGGFSKLTVKLQLVGEKKVTVKGGLDTRTGRFEATDKSGRVLSLLVGANSLSGSYGSYFVDGAQNKFTTKNAASKAIGSAALDKCNGVTTVAWRLAGDGPYHTLSVTIAAKGKAKITGTLADGTKVSARSQLIVGENWSCVPVICVKKGVRLAFNLWLPWGSGTLAASNLPAVVGIGDDVTVGRPGALKSGAVFRIDVAALRALLGQSVMSYLPDGMSVVGGEKWTLPKAGKVAYVNGTAMVDETKLGENPSGLKLTYKAKEGTFKGSFKAYVDAGGKPKATTLKVSGVVVDGVGYGAATVKKAGGISVTIE